jgi:hypothetical protein
LLGNRYEVAAISTQTMKNENCSDRFFPGLGFKDLE